MTSVSADHRLGGAPGGIEPPTPSLPFVLSGWSRPPRRWTRPLVKWILVGYEQRDGHRLPARRQGAAGWGACTRVMMVAGSRKARAARRRKRRMSRVDHDLSDAQWTALKAAWGGCAYCGASNTPLQRDCVLALSRGGRYTLGNIVPVCRSCNASKWNAEVTGWLRRKRLDERAFLLRHLEINAALALQFQGQTPSDVERDELGWRRDGHDRPYRSPSALDKVGSPVIPASPPAGPALVRGYRSVWRPLALARDRSVRLRPSDVAESPTLRLL
jgi:5-methylcytosine-specific restriction endonuclease McrA